MTVSPSVTQKPRRPVVCLRVDDVHARVPVPALEAMDTHLWGSRPLTLGTIPLVGWDCFRRDLADYETPVSRRSLWHSPDVVRYLDEAVDSGRAEVALHGLDHTDLTVDGRTTAELEAPSEKRVELMWRFLDVFGKRFDTRTVVPPHNFIAEDVAELCLRNGYHLSRAIPNALIRSLGLDPDRTEDRDRAKQRYPYQVVGTGVDLYQTLMISRRRIERRGLSAARLAEQIATVCEPTGFATVTFHWWDYFDPGLTLSESFCAFTRDMLNHLEQRLAPDYRTVTQAAEVALAA